MDPGTPLVAVTTIRQGSPDNPIEQTRAQVFLDTAAACKGAQVPLIAIHAGCSDAYLERLCAMNVTLEAQQRYNMGAVRREAMRAGLDRFPDAGAYLWLEPEKPGIVALAKGATERMALAGARFCFLNRTSFDSYPPLQAQYYQFCRTIASEAIGQDIDYAFGPMLFTRETAPHFLDYRGEYGDAWDAILIPRLRVLRSGTPCAIVPVDFRNDPRMTAIELGNPDIRYKRVQQFQNVVPSMLAEIERRWKPAQ